MSGRPYILLLLCVCLTSAVTVRGIAACYWQWKHLSPDKPLEMSDTESYWELGQHIAQGEPYQFRSSDRKIFRAPGYPLILAGMFSIVGVEAPYIAGRLLQAAIGTATLCGVFLLGKRLFGPAVGLVATAWLAIHPPLVVMDVLLLSETPFGFCLVLQLILWHELIRRTRGTERVPFDSHIPPTNSADHSSITAFTCGVSLATGIAGGIASLIRPSWLLFTPLLACVQIVGASKIRNHLVISFLIVLGLSLPLLPWVVRNWNLTGRVIPTTLQVGASLYDGWNPQATGASDMRFVDRMEVDFQKNMALLGQSKRGLPPASQEELLRDRWYRSQAMRWAWENPRRVGELALIKIGRMWNVWPNEPSFRSWTVRLLVLTSFGPMVALACFAIWRSPAPRDEILLLTSPAIYLTVIHSIFIGSIRYRQPALLPLAILAAWSGTNLCRRWTTVTPTATEGHDVHHVR